ncbi:alkaline phosphatase [Sediminivirga luteola]|uniref:Alkaline phosphatase n=1 Tax=Sediminivirga luteola TaxID=1774748 RepID=A0A8J2XKG5_9MICO|nr:alkaline phosphatase [Sediminivirga luteola]MCI2265833.1 alkaline phosphatase [Sediminivirga luteola]GGA14247.1 alkaline phosphatase [Sediminivirga luteola]
MSFSRSVRRCLGAGAALAVTGTAVIAAPALADTAEPRNIIVMIGDGMGYNHVDASSLYQHGQSNWQAEVDPATGAIEYAGSYGENPSQVYEHYDVQLGMSHHSLDSPVYDGEAAWAEFDWAKQNPTDSAASGTALATGVKTHNGYLGVDADQQPVENVAEYAAQTGRATGVVSSVPFGHATPASWGSHVASRGANHEIAQQMIDGSLDVVIGAGHPFYDDDAQPRDPEWIWLSEEQYTALETGETGYAFVDDSAGLEAVASGAEVPERLFGLAPVAETLQYNRTSLAEAEPRRDAGRVDGEPITGDAPLPFETQLNDVPSLSELSSAALNVLSQNDEGFFTMIEGGAIDWAGHANATTGNLEEMIDFNDAVETVHAWVEENSSWDETLLIVTADHETGYLYGPGDGTSWTTMTGEQGQLPVDGWYSGDHTNHLVPFFAHGAGADTIPGYVRGTDPVRGDYIDNTDVALLAFDLWAADEPTEPSPEPTTEPTAEPTTDPTAQPTTDPTAEPTTEPQPGGGPGPGDEKPAGPDDNASAPGSLPRTGSEFAGAALAALALIALGGGALYLARRKRQV